MEQTNKLTIKNVFNKGLKLHHYANTAYPLDGRKVWKNYKVVKDVGKKIENQWKNVEELGLYVHIPFCKKRCLYCEYTVLPSDEEKLKDEYVSLLIKEIKKYKPLISNAKIVGLDIGGGTPTSLPSKDIKKIIKNILYGLNLSDGFSISIETTPYIASTEKEKLSNR